MRHIRGKPVVKKFGGAVYRLALPYTWSWSFREKNIYCSKGAALTFKYTGYVQRMAGEINIPDAKGAPR